MSQLATLLDLLKKIDESDIPKNDFDAAFAVAVPIQRDEQINPSRPTVPVNAPKAKPATVKGLTQTAGPLGISLTTASERTAAEQEAEAKRKAAIAAQNKLPEWISTSTVTGEVSAVGIQERARELALNASQTKLAKTEEDEKSNVKDLDDELAAYYAQMATEREQAAAREESEDEDENENDEDEDLNGDGSNGATPSSLTSVPPVNGAKEKEGLLNGVLKHQDSGESGSSAPGTGDGTPVGSQALAGEGNEPPAKKARFAGLENGDEEEKATAPAQDSDEDEVDFEDVL